MTCNVGDLGLADHLQKGSATHSSILAWRILWTEELADNSEWDWKESDTTEPLSHYISYSEIHLILHFIVFIFHQHVEDISVLSLAFNVGDAKSDANMTGTFKVNHLLFPKYVLFCCWFYPLVFLNFIKLCLFLSLFFYSYLWTFADTIIHEVLGFSYVILICHFLVDVFFNFHLAFCFLKSLLVIWYNFQNVLSLNIIFSHFKLSDICPNIGESYHFLLIIPISGTELFHSIIKLTSIFFQISFFKKLFICLFLMP